MSIFPFLLYLNLILLHMSFVRIWLHTVWSTKNRFPYLNDNIRHKVFDHIKINGRVKGIHIDTVGGYTDHMHCLLSLGKDQNVSGVVQLIKGESSHWINKLNIIKDHFEWQDEYFAVSVSESKLNVVRFIFRIRNSIIE